ncbi:MAG: copper resistance CopC/CopD family protein [Thermoplasmatota archaeon]
MRAVAVLVLAVALLPLASAHANLLSASPPENAHLAKSPPSIELRFSEAVDPARTKVRVLDPHQTNVATNMTVKGGTIVDVGLEPRLADGVYTIAWHALSSVDSHSTSGTYALLIGNASAANLPATESGVDSGGAGENVGRYAAYVGALLVTGVAIFSLAILGPLAPDDSVARPRLALLAIAGGALLAIGAALALAGYYARGADPTLSFADNASLFKTRVGVSWIARIVAGLAVVAAAALARRAGAWRAVALVAGLGAILAEAATGHSSGRHPSLGTLADFVHGAAASAWLGGVPALIVTLASAGEQRGAVARRFSNLALGSVIVLSLAGLTLALLLFDRLDEVWATSYGQWLIAKTLLLGVLSAFGALNHFILIPRARFATLRRTATAEIGLALVLVVAVVGLAVGSPPTPSAVEGPPTLFAQDSHGLNVTLALSPGSPVAPGVHRYEVKLLRVTTGAAITNASVRLTFTYLDQDFGSSTIDLNATAGGVYAGDGGEVAFAGSWRAEVKISRPNDVDVFVPFEFSVVGS